MHMTMSIGRVLGGAVAALDHAADALRDLKNDRDPKRQIAAIKAIPTHGRSVTFILQKLRASVDSFDDWYEPRVRNMQTDPLMRYFVSLRNQIQKEGLPQPIYAVLYEDRGDAEVPVADLAVGEDSFGIWISGATRERIRDIDSSATFLRDFQLPDPPTQHLGRLVEQSSFEYLSELYLCYLRERLVTTAREKFILGRRRGPR
jgi:hypothetical protein